MTNKDGEAMGGVEGDAEASGDGLCSRSAAGSKGAPMPPQSDGLRTVGVSLLASYLSQSAFSSGVV